ncbi:MAG: threonine-phosphate decarboxylase [Gammaproteobacteria bacterium]|nr:threonine-phosphate decarboxylase [Gammaproteobacteria bacterium]
MLEHGGGLNHAAARYGIPLEHWLDLSTGINADGWPVPAPPESCWQRLPEEDDGLLEAAQGYYGSDALLAVAGSQAAIQLLPKLRTRCRVGLFAPAYAEHAHAWQVQGHDVTVLNEDAPDIDACDVVVVINPNNPSGRLWPPQVLQDWQERLALRDGWLVVDEAFMDATPTHSVIRRGPASEGLVVLRSLGKFFGLAGLRVGFVHAWPSLLLALREVLGPWSIAHPSRWVATRALQDQDWQEAMRSRLQQRASRLASLLSEYGFEPAGGTALFQWVRSSRARALQDALACQAVWVRGFDEPSSLRFGLPVTAPQWLQLERALQAAVANREIGVAHEA